MKRRAFGLAVTLSPWAPWGPWATARAQAAPRVAIFDGRGVGEDALAAARTALDRASISHASLGAADIRSGALRDVDAVLFTGGRGSHQGRDLGDAGREAVKSAVREGLGYVGICGGAFLALQGEPEFFKLEMVAARHATGDAWMRGIGPAVVQPTDGAPACTLHYANGPLMEPEATPDLAPPTVLATFETEYALPEHDTHPGQMRGRPAILSSTFARGRIVLFSPNPTLEPAVDDLLVSALTRVARGRAEAIDSYRSVFG